MSSNLSTQPYAVDGLEPGTIQAPHSCAELAETLREATERGDAIVPWGGGRHMGLGNIPSRYDVALSTRALSRLIEYEPADLTITVEAGMTMGALREILAKHGQFLPIDAPADATVGGVLAANVSGPSRHAYGLPRDWLIGCRVVHADGTVSKAGGRVVKNVAGYDMTKLYVGSLGTLGVIVEATFKVAPLPPAQETLVAAFDDLAPASEAVFATDGRGLALRAVALRCSAGVGHTTAAFWLSGTPSAVERSRRELAEICREAQCERLEGQTSEEFWSPPPSNDELRPSKSRFERSLAGTKASLPPSAVLSYMSALDGRAEETVAYPTTGLVLSKLRHADPQALATAIQGARIEAERLQGSLVVTSAQADVKRLIDVWGDAGDALPLMRALKQQFDPKGTLNPGRFIGGI